MCCPQGEEGPGTPWSQWGEAGPHRDETGAWGGWGLGRLGPWGDWIPGDETEVWGGWGLGRLGPQRFQAPVRHQCQDVTSHRLWDSQIPGLQMLLGNMPDSAQSRAEVFIKDETQQKWAQPRSPARRMVVCLDGLSCELTWEPWEWKNHGSGSKSYAGLTAQFLKCPQVLQTAPGRRWVTVRTLFVSQTIMLWEPRPVMSVCSLPTVSVCCKVRSS